MAEGVDVLPADGAPEYSASGETDGVDVLRLNFAFELNEVSIQQAAQVTVNVRFMRI